MRIERTFSIYFASIATFITLFVMAFFLFTVDTNWYETLLIERIFFDSKRSFYFYYRSFSRSSNWLGRWYLR